MGHQVVAERGGRPEHGQQAVASRAGVPQCRDQLPAVALGVEESHLYMGAYRRRRGGEEDQFGFPRRDDRERRRRNQAAGAEVGLGREREAAFPLGWRGMRRRAGKQRQNGD